MALTSGAAAAAEGAPWPAAEPLARIGWAPEVRGTPSELDDPMCGAAARGAPVEAVEPEGAPGLGAGGLVGPRNTEIPIPSLGGARGLRLEASAPPTSAGWGRRARALQLNCTKQINM